MGRGGGTANNHGFGVGCCDISIYRKIPVFFKYRYFDIRLFDISKYRKYRFFPDFFDKQLFFNGYIIIIMTFKMLL